MPSEHILMNDPDWQPTPVAELVFEPATPPATTAAAPTTYRLPPEPGPEATELWDRDGDRWSRLDDGWTADGWGDLEYGPPVHPFGHVLAEYGPLSTVPPEQTEASDA